MANCLYILLAWCWRSCTLNVIANSPSLARPRQLIERGRLRYVNFFLHYSLLERSRNEVRNIERVTILFSKLQSSSSFEATAIIRYLVRNSLLMQTSHRSLQSFTTSTCWFLPCWTNTYTHNWRICQSCGKGITVTSSSCPLQGLPIELEAMDFSFLIEPLPSGVSPLDCTGTQADGEAVDPHLCSQFHQHPPVC